MAEMAAGLCASLLCSSHRVGLCRALLSEAEMRAGRGAGAASVGLPGVCQSLYFLYVTSFKPNENHMMPPLSP